MAFVVIAGGVALACGTNAGPAGLEVLVATNLEPAEYDAVTIDVEQEDGAGSVMSFAPILTAMKLPTSLAIASGKRADESARIVVTAEKAGRTIVSRTVTVDVPTSRVAELVIVLPASCVGRCGAAPPMQDECAPVTLESAALPSYQASDLARIDAGARGLMDGSVCDASRPHDARPDVGMSDVGLAEVGAPDARRVEGGSADDGGLDARATEGGSTDSAVEGGVDASCNCVSSPFAGWDIVALTTETCPPGFGSPTRHVYGVTAAPVSCSCQCGNQDCAGSATLEEYSTATCAGTATTTAPLTFTNSCGDVSPTETIPLGSSYRLKGVKLAAAPAVCSATQAVTNRPTIDETYVSVCAPLDACATGACLTTEQQGAMCIAHAGEVQCPSPYRLQIRVANASTDTRKCGACTCQSNLTCTFDDLLMEDVACGSSGGTSLTATATCATAASRFSIKSSRAPRSASGSAACSQTTASTPTGGATLEQASTMTVCCT